MKATVLLLFLFCSGILFAQTSYTLRIVDTKGQPMKTVAVTAKNDAIVLNGTTDNTGTVVFTLVEPGTYLFSYLNQKDALSYEVKEGIRGTYKRTTTYDPQGTFAEKPNEDRTGIVFQTLNAIQMKGKPNAAKVTITVKEKNGTKVQGVYVDVVSVKEKTKYHAMTNPNGQAVFYVPADRTYEVDVAGLEAFHKIVVENHTGLEMEEVVYYEKTKVQERTKGDTIVQQPVTQTNGTSTHLLFTFNLKDHGGSALANEVVYADAENSKRVYEGRTDANGVCTFLLEKGTTYLISVKYERDMHLVDASKTAGFSSAMATRRYRGSAAIEQMLAEREAQAKASEKGFVSTFSETPVQTAAKPGSYLTKTPLGYDVRFAGGGEIGTPTLAGDKLFTQAGFHSPLFYCLQASTGQYLWGVELGESGMSPAVYHNGVVLINTYSCSLYALDAATGRLLWSKWLAGTIYSTPSADGEKVYVVYNNGGTNPKNHDEEYVLACFELRSGRLIWQSWVDREVIACPVVEGKEVHVVSHSGNYYVFDKVSGLLVRSSKKIAALSSPTLTPESIYLTATVSGKEQLVMLDRATLQVKKTYPAAIAAPKIVEAHGSYGAMNFNGAHPVVYKGKVVLADRSKIVCFDAATEKVLWEKPVDVHQSQLPVVANDKVYIATKSGEVLSFDLNTGASTVAGTTAAKGGDGQPVCGNGFLYIASAGVISVIKAVKSFQWEQWNRDARHNPYWE